MIASCQEPITLGPAIGGKIKRAGLNRLRMTSVIVVIVTGAFVSTSCTLIKVFTLNNNLKTTKVASDIQ